MINYTWKKTANLLGRLPWEGAPPARAPFPAGDPGRRRAKVPHCGFQSGGHAGHAVSGRPFARCWLSASPKATRSRLWLCMVHFVLLYASQSVLSISCSSFFTTNDAGVPVAVVVRSPFADRRHRPSQGRPAGVPQPLRAKRRGRRAPPGPL